MNYYNITLAYDTKVIGVKNGIYQVELIEKMYDKNTFSKFKAYFLVQNLPLANQLPDFNVEFYFKKFKLTKETSFMSFCPYLNHCHFLINENIQSLFDNFKIQPHKQFKTSLYDTVALNPNDGYKMFFSIVQDWDVIDFKNSVFTSGGYGNIPLIEHKFANHIELNNFNGMTKVKSLALAKKFDNTLDFFHTRLGGLFFSERLKVAIESSNSTGIVFSKKIEVII